MLMGGAAVLLLLYSRGRIATLVVMYSINVFLTFSLSQLGMTRFFIKNRKTEPKWKRHLPVHLIGLAVCVTILVVTSIEKFALGGWLTFLDHVDGRRALFSDRSAITTRSGAASASSTSS